MAAGDYECSRPNHKVNNVKSSNDDSLDHEEDWVFSVQAKPQRPVQCRMTVADCDVIFTIDPGASVNVLPVTVVQDKIGELQPTTKNLKMWNNSDVTPLGSIRLSVSNPANMKKYNVEFTIVEDELTPLLGVRAATQMGLVSFNENNIERVSYVQIEDNYKDVLQGILGSFDGTVHLSVDDTVTPVVMPSRRVPITLRPKLKAELDRMQKLGVIAPVSQPTPWVSQIAITQKRSGDLRICLDPQELNKALQREHYTLPILEDTLHELGQSRVFSKADLSSGYWHCVLDEESSFITTFQTCFGRYRWLRLPFGLNVSSEIFQRKLTEALDGLPGVVCIADDVLIHGKDVNHHDENLKQFLTRCREKNIRLNPNKLELRLSEITFMGHVITKDGLKSDPEKVRAIHDMPVPSNTEELRRFLGLVNYLAKFLPNLTEVTTPMRNLTKKDVPWTWSKSQQDSFDKVKFLVSSTPVLSFYDPAKPATLENDVCEHGLGSVLLQEGRPVAYASHSLTDAERRYAQIEKELLAVVFGLQKFHHYTYGRHVSVITDHKPLVAIYQPGTTIPIADTLSRAPLPDKTQLEPVQVNSVMYTNITDHSLDQIKAATLTDDILSQLKTVIVQGWPDIKNDLSPELRTYFSYRDELTVHDGLLLRGSRVVIPASMREELKRKLHVGHMGINSCLRRAKSTVFWPLMSSDIRQYIESCDICQKFCDKHSPEPLYMHEIPDHPLGKSWK
ncbi:uncharacterized protein K02A2.6-like [Haliotis rubra]|uniref:uncharacterized protein K02A2.6-like n=1 Tax=Haliotis rubra TaxID=36100 RepID=UPI001EE62687|nr:uncharacterized protein K02A2.6-like [Haliotis rubra]